MSDHLPECPFTGGHSKLGVRQLICVCPELRVCQERVLRDAVEVIKALPVDLIDTNGSSYDWNPCYRYGVRLTAAVAAIEALGGE